jgi:hypothetical protein
MRHMASVKRLASSRSPWALTTLVAIGFAAGCSGSLNDESRDGGAKGAASSSSGGSGSASGSGSSGSDPGDGSGASAESGTCSAGRAAITLASGQSNPIGVAVDTTSVYWIDIGGNVMKVALIGGTAMTLASDDVGPWAIALDATSVYWTNIGGGGPTGTVMKVSLGGGTATTLASGQSYPFGIVTDATSVYWTGRGPTAAFPGGFPSPPPPANAGTVMKRPLGGGAATTLACGQSDPSGIAVDATSVYWTNPTSGTVMKLPK